MSFIIIFFSRLSSLNILNCLELPVSLIYFISLSIFLLEALIDI